MKMNEHNGSRKQVREKVDKLMEKLVKEQARNPDTRPAQALQELIVKALDHMAPAHLSKGKAEELICDSMLGHFRSLLELLNS